MSPDCSNHKKEVAGISDMKVLADAIGDLHYETLSDLLDKLCDKLFLDAARDRAEGRIKLAKTLDDAAVNILFASAEMELAWDISKPYMDNQKPT